MNQRLERLARLFEYPGEDYVRYCREAGLDDFATEATALGTTGLQELYIGTFDWNPSASLDLGWHLYGEQYQRGEFLVEMRDRLSRYGIAETGELPDHITHVLAVVAKMDAEAADRFSRDYAAPAVAKLLAALEHSHSPFAAPVRAVRQALPVQVPLPAVKTELPILREEGAL